MRSFTALKKFIRGCVYLPIQGDIGSIGKEKTFKYAVKTHQYSSSRHKNTIQCRQFILNKKESIQFSLPETMLRSPGVMVRASAFCKFILMDPGSKPA